MFHVKLGETLNHSSNHAALVPFIILYMYIIFNGLRFSIFSIQMITCHSVPFPKKEKKTDTGKPSICVVIIKAYSAVL